MKLSSNGGFSKKSVRKNKYTSNRQSQPGSYRKMGWGGDCTFVSQITGLLKKGDVLAEFVLVCETGDW